MNTETCESPLVEPVVTSSKVVNPVKVKELFCSYINEEANYTQEEYKKFAVNAYKEASKKKKSSSKESTVKRPPTKYNIFIKDEMARLRQENPKIEFKELMKLAAVTWNKNKESVVKVEVTE
jgi:hypothetical protein